MILELVTPEMVYEVQDKVVVFLWVVVKRRNFPCSYTAYTALPTLHTAAATFAT